MTILSMRTREKRLQFWQQLLNCNYYLKEWLRAHKNQVISLLQLVIIIASRPHATNYAGTSLKMQRVFFSSFWMFRIVQMPLQTMWCHYYYPHPAKVYSRHHFILWGFNYKTIYPFFTPLNIFLAFNVGKQTWLHQSVSLKKPCACALVIILHAAFDLWSLFWEELAKLCFLPLITRCW